MTDRAAILCVTIDCDHVDGARKEFCEMCGTEVWLAPSSFQWRDDGAAIFCMPCGLGVMATERDAQLIKPTKEQYAELREHHRRNR